MSHDSNHSDSNYPEDGVSHYPHQKGAHKSKGLHNVAKHLNSKTRALRKLMGENGGRHGNTKPEHGGYMGETGRVMPFKKK